MQKWFLFLFLYLAHLSASTLNDYLVKVEYTAPEQQLSGIDRIYLLNLDHRTDRLQKSLERLDKYGLVPQRVPAVYGKKLQAEAFNAVGFKYLLGMEQDWVHDFTQSGKSEIEYLRKEVHGQVFFSKYTSRGAVGCALSHISAIKDGYDSGCETIWILEDDFDIKENPHLLSSLMYQLDEITNRDWDILYTNLDLYPEKDIEIELEWQWRPDIATLDPSVCPKRTIINDQFTKVSYRSWAYSYILRRSGMKKMLDYFNTHHIFLPIDHEISLVPGMQIYCSRKTIVTFSPDGTSDIQEPL